MSVFFVGAFVNLSPVCLCICLLACFGVCIDMCVGAGASLI